MHELMAVSFCFSSGVQESPRVVQLMSAPYNRNVVLDACPARFGLDLSVGDVGVSVLKYGTSLYKDRSFEGLGTKPAQMTFQIAFCCFSSDSPEFLHVALNSFSNVTFIQVLSAALRFVL